MGQHMYNKLFDALAECGTDVEGTMQRLAGNAALYNSCLEAFLQDSTMTDLSNSIANKRWDDAFTAAHALKGLAGNMGFIPLYHATAQLVILIRNGKIADIDTSVHNVRKCYDDIILTIQNHVESSN